MNHEGVMKRARGGGVEEFRKYYPIAVAGWAVGSGMPDTDTIKPKIALRMNPRAAE